MATTRVFRGYDLAKNITDEVKTSLASGAHGFTVFRDRENSPAVAYTQRIQDWAEPAGLSADVLDFPPTLSAFEGILSQLTEPVLPIYPLPKWLSTDHVIAMLGPERDAEGLHPVHAGRLLTGSPGLIPPTAHAAYLVADRLSGPLRGKRVAVVGASAIVGRPLATLLMAAEATVRVAHAETADLHAETRDADIVISATGVPGLLKHGAIKDGAICIDVGVSRVNGVITGDFDATSVEGRAAWRTHAPDGVGPVTVACLMRNLGKLISGDFRSGLWRDPVAT